MTRAIDRGAAIDLSAVEDMRAAELERRIVLSQYLTAVNCAATGTSSAKASWRDGPRSSAIGIAANESMTAGATVGIASLGLPLG
ncbi:hypothetical protein OCAE111667_17255 [Occultella aeris]|uniref:Uncharacterized protein n=1 Tax=Occultella aeris TaxID=2761496 RepID=A0A7M4DMF0_9MICO|nr:hypothetical protein [Occultella aeris]VZO38560.1 hypothetical protein HALOF300_03321 [Occultella aeris]